MNLEVKIVNEFGWFRFNDIFWSIGYIYDENNIALKGRDLYNYLKPILENKELLESTLKKINGSFLIVAKISPQIIIITDKVCSYRVFYHLNENSFAISDKLIYLKNQYNCPVDNLSIEEFLSCGFVTGRESLFGNIYQTRGGEMIYIENCKIDIKSYFHSRKETLKEEKLDTYRNNYQNILSNICERLQKNSEDKQYVLSLSGGYDSRLIASLLKKSGVNNVICFTYGKKNSYELELSRKITNTLGFNLVEIVYTDDFLHNYLVTDEFYKFIELGSNFNTIPHIQDYFAVKYLIDNNLITSNAVILTGHIGQYFYFYFKNQFKNFRFGNRKFALDYIFHDTYVYKKSKYKKEMKSKISKYIIDGAPYEIYDDWSTNERFTKYGLNSIKTYEMLGLEHREPLLDSELINFFCNLPFQYKIHKNFYHCESEKIFKEMGIDFSSSAYSNRQNNWILDKLKDNDFIRKMVDKYSYLILRKYKDPNNFEYIINQLIPDAKISGTRNMWYKGNIIKWYEQNYLSTLETKR